jgi:hypothetical protein
MLIEKLSSTEMEGKKENIQELKNGNMKNHFQGFSVCSFIHIHNRNEIHVSSLEITFRLLWENEKRGKISIEVPLFGEKSRELISIRVE